MKSIVQFTLLSGALLLAFSTPLSAGKGPSDTFEKLKKQLLNSFTEKTQSPETQLSVRKTLIAGKTLYTISTVSGTIEKVEVEVDTTQQPAIVLVALTYTEEESVDDRQEDAAGNITRQEISWSSQTTQQTLAIPLDSRSDVKKVSYSQTENKVVITVLNK